jgi:CheY-like chemotaxis protein
MSEPHILIVDDEHDSAELVAMLLNSGQIASTIVHSAADALSKLAADPGLYHAAIVDLAMPGMDGFALLMALRRDPVTANLPVIAITAYHTPELRSRATKAGFTGYFPKPLDTTVFLGTVGRLLRS